MIRKSSFVGAALSVFVAVATTGITSEQAERLRQRIRPQADESPWAQIPWQTNLKEARIKAVRADKPLLLWRSGGGDVLGRT